MANLKELNISEAWDCHTHSGGVDFYNMFQGNIPYTQSVDDLVKKATDVGITHIITFPFPSTSYYNPTRVDKISGLQDFPYQIENNALLKSCDFYQGRVFPFLCIDPRVKQEEQLKQLKEFWHQKKFYGLKLHTYATKSKATDLLRSGFSDFIASENIPLLVHSGVADPYSKPQYVLELAKEIPSVRICIAHLGRFDSDVLSQISKSKNLFTDCAPFLQLCNLTKIKSETVHRSNLIDLENPSMSLYEYYKILKGHLLWGTDEPWTSIVESDGSYSKRYSYEEEVDLLQNLFRISPQAVIDITSTNTKNFIFGN